MVREEYRCERLTFEEALRAEEERLAGERATRERPVVEKLFASVLQLQGAGEMRSSQKTVYAFERTIVRGEE